MENEVIQELTPEIVELQQFFYELFGDRDWNEYKLEEHSFLKRNIGYAMFGSPGDANIIDENVSESESGYNKKQCLVIDEIYNVILKNNFHETSIVHIRFIFICCELKNKKKTLMTEPVFVVRKCRNKEDFSGKENCKIYIDSHGRVYQNWNLYLENNKLPKCSMVYPKDGEYSGSIIGEDQVAVIVEARNSPACDIGKQILEGTDTAGTVISVATTATFVAAAIPGLVVAPIVLAGAAIGGVGVGIYSVGRSIQTLVDRQQHDQSIGLDNAESRWCWLNTTVGILGAGASAASGLLTRAVSKGSEISQAAKIAFNTITAANIVGSGVNLAFSGYHLIDKILNKETVTPLEVFQFASSILFFHNSVVGFRMASTIISETQTATLKSYEASLRSNRHRKVFKKAQLEARRLRGEVAGNAEIIKGIQNINDPDNFFAGLVRINKDLNQNGARYTITGDGKIKINSNYIVDPMEFASIGKDTRAGILSSLPPRQTTPTVNTNVSEITFAINRSFMTKLSDELLRHVPLLSKLAQDVLTNKLDMDTIAILLEKYSTDVIQMLFQIFIQFLNEIYVCLKDFQKVHPMVSLGVGAIQFLITYVENCSSNVQMQVKSFLRTFFNHDQIDPERINMLADLFKQWLKTKIETLRSQTVTDGIENLVKQRLECKICIGYHYVVIT